MFGSGSLLAPPTATTSGLGKPLCLRLSYNLLVGALGILFFLALSLATRRLPRRSLEADLRRTIAQAGTEVQLLSFCIS